MSINFSITNKRVKEARELLNKAADEQRAQDTARGEQPDVIEGNVTAVEYEVDKILQVFSDLGDDAYVGYAITGQGSLNADGRYNGHASSNQSYWFDVKQSGTDQPQDG